MPNMSSNPDIESQQTVLLVATNPPRDLWRWIFLVLHARQILLSRADKTRKGYRNVAAVSSSSPHGSSVSDFSNRNANLELKQIEEDLPTSPQRLVEVLCSGTNDSTVSDVKLQHANISKIVKAKDLGSLKNFAGIQGIAEALDTDLEKGIPGHEDDLCCRRITNTLSKAQDPVQGFVQLVLKSCNNYIVFLLFASAVMSISFGIKQEGLKTGWYGGAIIFLAIIVLVLVSSLRDFCNQNLMELSEKRKVSETRQAEFDVLRGGNSQKLFISDVVIGDIVCLRRGDEVPGDGLFVSGEYLKLDDGLATINEQNPFLHYGAKVINGQGRMLVTTVGINTAWGETMSQISHTPCKTPLPAQLDKVSFWTQIIGLSISILIPVFVFLHFKLQKENHDSGMPDMKGKPKSSEEIMEAIKGVFMKPNGKFSILTNLLTLVVGIVEGVPFIITLALTYWNKKALSYAFFQDLLACISLGSVTTICTDKTGGLMLNPEEILIDTCWIGEEAISEDSFIHADVLEALCNGISTPFLRSEGPSSSIDDSLLSWATLKLGEEMEILKQSCTIIDAKDLSSKDGSGVLMRKNRDEESHMWLHWRGPAETILRMCSSYYDSEGAVKNMDENKRGFEQIIEQMHSKHLKTMAFAFKRVDAPTFEENSLTLIGLLGLKQISRIETRKATKACRNAGINIILISEDNVSVLKAIGVECGLLPKSDSLVLEAEEFRNCTNERRLEMVDKISVIGNSLPSDKLLLVQCLKQKGHMVAMVGVRTKETPAIKEATVGIAMGTSSSKLARESSDIIIWDGRLTSLVNILGCGRCAYENIQKYIQLEVTMVIAGLLITTSTTVAFGETTITAFQLSWINLVVSVLSGLALLTEPLNEKLMERQPVRKTDPFITKTMWRNIIIHALFQAGILVTFQYKSKSILQVNEKVCKTMIFNSFMLCQVFNQFNAREPKLMNIFKGIQQNLWFWVGLSLTVVLQVAFIEIAHILVGNAKLNVEQWGICVLIGMLSLAIDLATKSISNFIMYCHSRSYCSHIGSRGMTNSESASNLELPLINLDSSTIPS